MSITYVIPLLPYERSLILEADNFLNSRGVSNADLGQPCSPSDAFKSWRWYNTFSRWLADELDFEDIALYGGGRKLAYDRCLRAVANLDLHQKNLYRVNTTCSSNTTFLEELDGRPCNNIIFQWSESDVHNWEVVSRIVNAFGQPWRHPDSLDERFSCFEIWELIRTFFLHFLCPKNADLIGQHLIQHPVFETFFQVSNNDWLSKSQNSNSLQSSHSKPLFESLVIRKRKPPVASSRANMVQLNDSSEITDDLIKSLLLQAAQQKRYQDPRAYLRFIPWTELEPISPDQLKEFGIDLNLLLKYETRIHQWVLWNPQLPGYATNHHLFVEDELFSYSIDKSWPLPGHYRERRVIFGVESLSECGLVRELEKFWSKWNDCAVTKRDDGEVCVLQTIPGIHLRLRTAQLDYEAALNYYRSIIEVHASQIPSGESVKELLGISNNYNPLYENTLRLIPNSAWTIHDIDWKSPIAKSSRSAVYAATLRRQRTVLYTSECGDEAVVLKDVIPRSTREITDKFMKELDATWFALGGAARSCVKFYGLARVELDGANRLMLVSERATQGSIMEFLEREFKKTLQHSKRWELLGSALSGISSGLGWIHKHNVVHRDLHPGNVFVTDRVFRLDPNIPHEYDYMLGDLGEGKKLDPSATGQWNYYASYGAIDYRAPEQFETGFDNNNLFAAMAAEVYSFGKLACKLLECHMNCTLLCESIPNEVLMDASSSFSPEELAQELEFLVPTTIRDTVGLCLSQLPAMRPHMEEVGRNLEDLWCDLKEDDSDNREEEFKVKWCLWNWKKLGTVNTENVHEDGGETSPTIDPDDI